MEARKRSTLRKVLWFVLPIAAIVAIASVPRALAWGRHHRAGSPAELAEHMEHGLDHLLDKVDADDAQRDQASAIAERRAPELFAIMKEGRELRLKAKEVLLAEQLDKQKLEQLRGQLDTVYARGADVMMGGIVELAELLTPAQRKELAERIARFEH